LSMTLVPVNAAGAAPADAAGAIPADVSGGGGGGGVATAFSLTLTHASGLVGASETLTVTPNGTWPSGRVLAVTQSVSLFSVGSFTQPSSGSSASVSIPLTVNAVGGPSSINVTDSGTSPLSSTGSLTYSSTSGTGTLRIVQTFSLTNWNGAGTSVGYARQGVPFKKGDVPAGTGLEVRRGSTVINAQFDERSTWNDGSLKHAVMHLRDTTYSASEARTYDVWSMPSTAFSNIGIKSLTDITGAHDFKVAFTLLKETAWGDGSDTDITTVGSGSFTAAFNTHAAVATRVEKNHVGIVCEGWVVWGMARDNTGGAADAHLKTNWYIDIWKTSAGAIYGYEVGAVVAQDWWSVAGKKRRNYNAALMDGATTIKSYTGIRHTYESQWLTAETTGLQRGKRFWVGGAQPTLHYSFDKSYWVQSKLIPPYDTTYTPLDYASHGGLNSDGVATYIPMSAQCHRYEFNATGEYQGRGMICNADSTAFMRQTAADTACARVSCLGGLHTPFHRRSNRTRTRPGDSGVSDTANTVCSLILDIGTAPGGLFENLHPMPSHNFTAQGLPAPVHAYAALKGGTSFNGISTTDGYVAPGGGTWPYFNSGNNSSHKPNYCYYMYLVEGERYVLESVLDYGMAATQDGGSGWDDSLIYNMNLASSPPNAAWNNARPPAEKALFVGGPFCAWPFRGEMRDFNPAILGSAIGIVPDAHVAHDFFKRWQLSLDVGMDAMLYTLHPNWLQSGDGPYLHTEGIPTQTPWMAAITCLGHYHGAAVTESSSQLAFANHYAKQMTGIMTYTPGYVVGGGAPQKLAMLAKTEHWDPVTNPYFAWGQNLGMSISLYAADYVPNQAPQLFRNGGGQHAGDMLWWHSRGYSRDLTDPAATPPAGVTPGQPLYVKSTAVSGSDGIITTSLTPGGSNFVFTTGAIPNGPSAGDVWAFSGPTNDWAHAIAGRATGGDSYASMIRAVIIHAKLMGNSTATQDLIDRADFCLDTSGYPLYTAWMYR